MTKARSTDFGNRSRARTRECENSWRHQRQDPQEFTLASCVAALQRPGQDTRERMHAHATQNPKNWGLTPHLLLTSNSNPGIRSLSIRATGPLSEQKVNQNVLKLPPSFLIRVVLTVKIKNFKYLMNMVINGVTVRHNVPRAKICGHHHTLNAQLMAGLFS